MSIESSGSTASAALSNATVAEDTIGGVATPAGTDAEALRAAPERVRRIYHHWRWKFGQHPLGCQSLLAVANNTGRIVGHIGGIPYEMHAAGVDRPTVQTVDHMIDPDCRRGLRRPGLFTRLMRGWIKTYMGPDRSTFGWGFPSREAFRIGQRFCGYDIVHSVVMLVHRKLHRRLADVGGIDVVIGTTFGPDVNELWRVCRAEHRMAHARTRRYLDWRYRRHPDVAYTALAARDTHDGTLRGIAVTRRGGLAPDTIMIMDWLVPAGDDAARRALLAAIGGQARQQPAGAVLCWFPEATREHALFRAAGFSPAPTSILMAGRTFAPDLSLEEVRRSLYLTFGDIDYL